jgi:hypothetical protein
MARLNKSILTQLSKRGTDLLRNCDVREVDAGITELNLTLSACAHLLNYHVEYMNGPDRISNNLAFGIADVLRREAYQLSKLRVKMAYGINVKDC